MKDKNDKDDKTVITIMSDYCADGLWLNGAAIYPDYLHEDLNFSKEFIDKIRDRIETWQNMYEGYNLYTSRAESQKVYDSADFEEFERLGEEIYKEFLDLDQDEYIIEYFDERTSERRRDNENNKSL